MENGVGEEKDFICGVFGGWVAKVWSPFVSGGHAELVTLTEITKSVNHPERTVLGNANDCSFSVLYATLLDLGDQEYGL
ncbi:hypothetical protein SCA6_000556 [Theobroma cacao]